MKVTFGQKIKKLREVKGITQKPLSDLSQITQATISRIESGISAETSNENLKHLAIALNVTVDFLVDKTDRLTPDDRVSADPMAADIFEIYEKLSVVKREQLRSFAAWIAMQEESN